MLNKAKVSVLMAVYNGERYLRQSISSILEQTFTDFEFIIINDGSTDSSLSIIQSYPDNRIKLINNEKNIGVINTVNIGISLSQGEYIARMDCDDICLPERLEKEVKLLDEMPAISVVSANAFLIDDMGRDIGLWNLSINAKTSADIYRIISNDNCIVNSTVLIRSSVLKKHIYNSNQKTSEDWDLWLRMCSNKETFFKMNEVLVKYRIHPASITRYNTYSTVYLKKSSVQVRFLFYEIKHLHFNMFNLIVFKNALVNCIKHLITSINSNSINGIKKIISTNPFAAFIQLFKLTNFYFSHRKIDSSLFFFFPFYHIGGAEKVHVQILSVVADKKPIVFITGISSGKGFYNEFNKLAEIVEVSLIADYPVLNKLVAKIILKMIKRSPHAIVFGCNSKFFYHLIPSLNPKVKCIDLIHAFVNYNETGPEYWSLPVLERIDKRVVINKKTIEDFKDIYAKNNKDSSLINRVEYISNYVEVQGNNNMPRNEKLYCLYVGRSSPEKRVHLIGEIAREVIVNIGNTKFILVGNMQNAIYEQDKNYCNCIGEIEDQSEIHKIYLKADILLLTSSREGFPMVIMEAMANGVVVISTNVGGISERIINGVNGILINSTDEREIIRDFVNAIGDLYTHRDKLQLLSENAYNYAKTNFDKKQFINSYRKLLSVSIK